MALPCPNHRVLLTTSRYRPDHQGWIRSAERFDLVVRVPGARAWAGERVRPDRSAVDRHDLDREPQVKRLGQGEVRYLYYGILLAYGIWGLFVL